MGAVFIPGASDGLVPLATTTRAGTLSHRVFPESHVSILWSTDFAPALSGWLAADLA